MKKILSLRQAEPEVFMGANYHLTQMSDAELDAFYEVNNWMLESGLD